MAARTVSTTVARVTSQPVRCWRYDLGIRESVLETVAYRGDACCSGYQRSGRPGMSTVTGSTPRDTHRHSQTRNRLMIRPGHNVIRRRHKLNVKHNPVSMWRALMLSMLIPLLTACAPSLTKPSDSPNTIPDLSPLARQPARSSVCSPTCLKRATDLTSQQQKRLSDIGLQESHASDSTTP